MRNSSIFFYSLILSALFFSGCSTEPKWHKFDQATFDKAKQENKFVILNLKANWCHWCHVMSDSTYQNENVLNYSNKHFILTSADQDANPDLANRYKKYGWPATIILDANGNELVKRRGYINPRDFLKLLQKIVRNPNINNDSHKKPSQLSSKTKYTKALKTTTENHFDFKAGGYKQRQKYIDYDAWEYAISNFNNEKYYQWITKSVEGAYHLEDPVWSGIYQYSTHGDWKHPHYEKLLSIQARYINIFIDHYTLTNSQKSLETAIRIASYCDKYLLTNNGLYASAQDADLIEGENSGDYYALNNEKRLKKGIPRIDNNCYTNSNAAMCIALYRLGNATNDMQYFEKSQTILDQLISKRKTKNCTFKHNISSNTSNLSDNIEMLNTFVFMYNQTKKNEFKVQGIELLKQLKIFQQNDQLYSETTNIIGLKRIPLLNDNIKLIRLFNLAGHYWDLKEFKLQSKKTLANLLKHPIVLESKVEAALLLGISENNLSPIHLTFIELGTQKSNFQSFSKNFPIRFSVIEIIDANEMSKDQKMIYGNITAPTLFSCNQNTCSFQIKKETHISLLIP